MGLRPRPRTWALCAIWLVPGALALALTWCVYSTYRIQVPPPLSDAARAEVMATLRQAMSGEPTAPVHPELGRELPHQGPVVATVWHQGRAQARVEGRGPTLARAVHQAARLLAKDPTIRLASESTREEYRIMVDVVVGRGPLAEIHALARAVGMHPGLEGLGVSVGDTEALLLPHELILHRMYGRSTPLAFVPDFRVGLDVARADKLLADRAGLRADEYAARPRRYVRIRTHSFVELPANRRGQGTTLPLVRGLPPRPELTAETLRDQAISGGKYLVAHLAENGRYIYERDLTTGRGTNPATPGPYSIPRHAGTTYFLAELYRLTGEAFLREPIERAFAHLGELIDAGGCTGTLPGGAAFACVVDRGRNLAELGSTALTVVALVEYHRATGDGRYDDLARRLTEWILSMQRPDGTFAHIYDIAAHKKDEKAELFYFSGEAALALSRMYLVTGEERYIDAAERALDALVGWYDFFMGGFFYGEEHWTCIAAEAAYSARRHAGHHAQAHRYDRYRVFCDGYAAFLRAQQVMPGDFPDQDDYAGSYNVTPFLVPQNTPAGSRTEAMISSYLLGEQQGKPNEAIRRQVLAAMHYALGQEIRPDSDVAVHSQASGMGGIPATPVERVVRIDYVQHVCSAMIRSLELIESAQR